MAIFVWDSFELLPQLAPDARPLRLLKMILKEVGTSKVKGLTFGLGPVIRLGIRRPRKKKRKKANFEGRLALRIRQTKPCPKDLWAGPTVKDLWVGATIDHAQRSHSDRQGIRFTLVCPLQRHSLAALMKPCLFCFLLENPI